MRRAVLLDRDGTINEDVHFLTDPAQLRLLPGAAEAIRRMRAQGYLAIVTTNQSGIARGLLDEATLARIHERLQALLAAEGARIDAFYYCPHLEGAAVAAYAGPCRCRKPEPGLLLRAAEEHGVDLAASVAVGDKERDVEAGLRAGCRAAYLVHPTPPPRTRATTVLPDLSALLDRDLL